MYEKINVSQLIGSGAKTTQASTLNITVSTSDAMETEQKVLSHRYEL